MYESDNVLIYRILENCVRSPNGCLIWKGAATGGWKGNKYGRLMYKKKLYLVHRTMLVNKLQRELKPGMQANHARKCSSTLCCEPEHLYEGTQEQNMQDRKELGRYLYGEQHCNTTLTDNEVELIRNSNLSQRAIAKKFGCSQSTVWRLRNNLVRAR